VPGSLHTATATGRKIVPVYIALLRGVNVGGNVLKMDQLREMCAMLGFANARTYVQSGNVVFEAADKPARWLGKLERALAAEVRLPVSVIVRKPAEVRALIARNPFVRRPGVDPAKLHVTFLAQAPGKDGKEALAAIAVGSDECRLVGHNVYLHCPNGYGQSKLSNNALEKALGVKATTRNWNTVKMLDAMSAGRDSG
jgi:uncharacterized protein (DUF1697 family)